MVVDVTLGEADAIGCFAGGDDDFLDAEFARGFDYVVSGQDVAFEAFIIGDEHVAGCRVEVSVDLSWRVLGHWE